MTTLTTLEKVLVLKSVPLLKAIPGEEIAAVAQIADVVDFPAGTTFIRQGEPGDCLYVIVSGDVDVQVEGAGTIATMGAHSVVGEMAVLARIPRTASCQARSDVLALQIDREDFWDLMRDQVEIAFGVIRELIARLEESHEQLARASQGGPS